MYRVMYKCPDCNGYNISSDAVYMLNHKIPNYQDIGNHPFCNDCCESVKFYNLIEIVMSDENANAITGENNY